MHRFANAASNDGNGLRWDIAAICAAWTKACAPVRNLRLKESHAIGVDGWAVDYVRLSPTVNRSRILFVIATNVTVEAQNQVHSRISPDRLYELTGVQILSLNTLYQLRADRDAEQNLPWINLPEFLLHRLGGRRVSEYTNATHTQLLGVQDQAWCC